MIGETRTKPMEILLVEDSLMDARVTIFSLRRSGIHHRLTLVRTVEEAVQFLNRRGVYALVPEMDLVLLDLMLPDGNGTDVLNEMRKAGGDETMVTTVVLSACDDESERTKCDQLGVQDYIQKPVSEAEFLRVVREHKQHMIDNQRPPSRIVPSPHHQLLASTP